MLGDSATSTPNMGFSEMTQEQADGIGWVLGAVMFLLPLGWIFFGSSVGFATLAITQLVVIFLTVVGVYRLVLVRRCGQTFAVLAVAVSYFASCFLTNWLGEVILARHWHL